MGPKDLNQEIIEQFKAIENNFGTILYRPEDHKYIILFVENHEINSIEKKRIIEEIIKISSSYEIDIFVEEKFKFMINSRFNKEWINVEYLYDQIKSLPQESVKSRIHNIDIRNSFCYPNNYFHEYNYKNLENIIKLKNNKNITDDELNHQLELFERYIIQTILKSTDYSLDYNNFKLITGGIKKLSPEDQEQINILINTDYVGLRNKLPKNLKLITDMIYDNVIPEENLKRYYNQLIDEPIFFIYSLLMDIYTMIRILKGYVKVGIFFGGKLHQKNLKQLLTTRFGFIEQKWN
jgi:uncharacterized protein YlbG (UPF0298 family)